MSTTEGHKLWVPHTVPHPIPRIQHGPLDRIDFVVIHVMEGTVQGSFAWWAETGHEADGAHFCVGEETAWQTTPLDVKCWHAGEANGNSVGIEHAGFHDQPREKWLDSAQLHLSANRCAWIHHEFDLGRPHKDKTVFAHGHGGDAWGGHPDCPGPTFPWDHYMRLCLIAYMEHWAR